MTELYTEQTSAPRLLSATSGIRRALRRLAGRPGGAGQLSEAQRELVRTVRRQPGIRVSEAAAELHLAANTVSTLVTGLCALEWLRRETDPLDRRSAVLFLTPAAEERVAEWQDRRLAMLSDALERLSDDDRARIEQALPALERVVSLLEERS